MQYHRYHRGLINIPFQSTSVVCVKFEVISRDYTRILKVAPGTIEDTNGNFWLNSVIGC